MPEICQKEIPLRPWAEQDLSRLPGMRPVEMTEWLLRDECFDRQMAYRDDLISTRRGEVYSSVRDEVGYDLLSLILETVLASPGYIRNRDMVTRPDGVQIDLGASEPLLTAGRLVQEDLCVLEKSGEQHVLTGAILCFPASWTLAEKINRPLVGIHDPVANYGADIARRVQRMFDVIRVDQVLMRGNSLMYRDADLFQPRSALEERHQGDFNFLRVERQTLRRLPKTGAVVFAIHTYVLPRNAVSASDCTMIMGDGG